jgi:hypothetical protein
MKEKHFKANPKLEDETLEEFIKNHHKNEPYWTETEKEIAARNIKIGVEWQAERMYSEEDMKQAFLDGMFCSSGDTVDNAIEEWFEQFSKLKNS